MVYGDIKRNTNYFRNGCSSCRWGPSGVASAVTAAEQGMKTLIIERYGFFGGMSVAGLSGTIGGLTVPQPNLN